MRRLCCVLAWSVAVVAGALTVPMAWVATHVASEDGYVAFTEPLVSDSDLQAAVAAHLGDELARRAGLPPQAESLVVEAVRSLAERLAARPGYVEAWDETQRRSHRLVFGDPPADASDRFSIDLGPLAGYVAAELGDALPVDVPAPDQLLVAVAGPSQTDWIDQVKATPSRAVTGLIVTALAAVVAVLSARRRSTATAWLGLGAIAVAGALEWLFDIAVRALLDRMSAPSELSRTFYGLLADRAVDSFEGWLLWLATGGAVVAGLGVAMRVAAARRVSPSA